MSGEDTIAASSISLWCTENIPFGSQVTILSNPSKAGNKWIAYTLERPTVQIQMDREIPVGERLIILKRNSSYNKLFGYIGIPADKLEEATEEMAKVIAGNLQK